MNERIKTIEERVMQQVAEIGGVPLEIVKPESHLFDGLGLDSLDAIEIVMGVEEEFEVDIADKDVEEVVTVQGLIDVVRKHVGGEVTK